MKRKWKIAGGALAVLLVSCYAALHVIVRAETVRARAESELSGRTGYDVAIGNLRLTPWLGLAASNVSVSKDGARLFEGGSITGFASPLDLWRRRIASLTLEKPVLHLSLHDLFSRSGKSGANFSIGALRIDDGEVVVETGRGAPLRLTGVSVQAEHVSLGLETGLRLRAALPALDGSAELSLSGGPEEKRAEIAVYQKPAEPAPKTAQGKKVFGGQLRLSAKGENAYEATAAGQARGLRWAGETIDGELASRFEIGAGFESVLLSVDVKTPRFPAGLLPGAAAPDAVPASAALRGDYSAARKTLTLQKISIASEMGALDGGGAVVFTESPARLAASLRLSEVPLDRLRPVLPRLLGALSYTGKMTGNVSVSGVYNDPVVAGTVWNEGGSARSEKVSLGRLSFKIPFQWSGGSLRSRGGRLQAEKLAAGGKGRTRFTLQRASLTGDIVKERQKPVEMSADFQLLAGGFSTPDEAKIAEHLNAKGRFACRDCGADAAFQGEVRIESLELLWNKFFGDFKDRRPAVKIDGIYRKAADELKLNQLAVALDSIGRLDVKGTVGRLSADPLFDLEIRSDDLRPAGFYDFFIRDAFKTAYPVLGGLGLGGKSALALAAKGARASFTLEGRLRLEDAAIQEKTGRWRAGSIALDLPLKIGYPRAPKDDAAAAPAGKLSVGEIRSATMTIPKFAAPLALWNNALVFPEPVRLALFGGAGTIRSLAWKDIVNAPADVSFALELSDLQLTELTRTLGWHRFDGALSGSIPQIRWAGDTLKTDGAMTLGLFGGRASIHGLEIEKPFSALRSIKMSATLDGLDLEQASRTFEFGRITGAVSGTIADLVFSQGQPAGFQAEIHTVDKPGTSRWISVEALNKITVVSSGNNAGSLYGGLAGWFDSFRYDKLGFKAALKNDTLTLRGIESKNGLEYLVVGSWIPPTVNIVSYTQEIGFSELVRRLEQAQKSGAKK